MSLANFTSYSPVPATQPHPRRRRHWLRRSLNFIGLALLLLIATGIIYQTMGAQIDTRRYPPPGKLVDVGGYQLHLHCLGAGSPTVVLESLSGGFSSQWAWVQNALAQQNAPTQGVRVCAYDRAGRAWSEPSPHPITGEQVARDLHTLLANAGESGPFVLVGHSIGGAYVRHYAAAYPDEVAGVVLVDSIHPEQIVRSPEIAESNATFLRLSRLFPLFAAIGVNRLYFALGGTLDFGGLPPQQRAETAMLWSLPSYFNSQHAEASAALRVINGSQTLGDLGARPLAVVTAGQGNPSTWPEFQAELATLSTNSIHITVADATHAGLAFDAQSAAATTAAIQQVIEAVQTGTPLTAP
jgi:pimeloyl-ACP methyl ester carboxylesterase